MVELCSLPAIDLGPNYGGGDGDKDDLPQKVPRMHCRTQCPQPCSRPPPTHASARDSQTPAGKSPVGSLLLSPGSWCTRSCLCPPRVTVLCKFWQLCSGVNGDLFQEELCHPHTQSPCPCSKPLLTAPSTGDAQTQLCLSLCGVPGSCAQVCLSPLSVSGGNGVWF